jgi:NTE family protein
MITAFVLSGGGSLGAVQVGMLQALAQRRIRPDLLVGTSAGALNAAYVAGHGTGEQSLAALAASWSSVRWHDIFPLDPVRHLQAVTGARAAAFSDRGMRRLIAKHINYARLEDAALPLHVVTTNLLTGEEVVLAHGDAASAVLASTAIPGVFPAVDRDDLTLVDGGLADNTAISVAADLGAERIYVLPAGFACALTEPPATATAAALQALGFLTQQRLIADLVRFDGLVDLKVLPPLCPVSVSAANFRHGAELIERARRSSGRWLDHGGVDRPHQQRFLAPHSHSRRPAGATTPPMGATSQATA